MEAPDISRWDPIDMLMPGSAVKGYPRCLGASRTRTQNIADDGYQGDPIGGDARGPCLGAEHAS
jgi:hypothetical protein